MSDTVIRVENLGKKYIIGHQQEGKYRYKALRDVVSDGVKSFGKFLRHPSQITGAQNTEEFWALKNVSFEVKRGEVVGIIGRNGAGKSTLLKILSRITEPTTGRVSLKGRVASLLEVGTGFHPELTGRENIFLNGAILGMSRVEINKKFDEIVEFAEVSKFLDTPVKRYSSGMYVRLAFAVAAHLEPEILVIDEVLAVGDILFQKKCLGKIGEMAGTQNRTILFVTHNIAAAQSLCTKGITLSKGKINFIGSTKGAIENYVSTKRAEINLTKREKSNVAWFTGIHCKLSNGEVTQSVASGQELSIVISYQAQNHDLDLSFNIGIYDYLKQKLLHIGTKYSGIKVTKFPKEGKLICFIPKLPLVEGKYHLNISLFNNNERVDYVTDILEINVYSGDFYGTGKIPAAGQNKFFLNHEWKLDAFQRQEKNIQIPNL